MGPGWYEDPGIPGQLRWWDGRAWSPQVRPAPMPTASGPASGAPAGTAFGVYRGHGVPVSAYTPAAAYAAPVAQPQHPEGAFSRSSPSSASIVYSLLAVVVALISCAVSVFAGFGTMVLAIGAGGLASGGLRRSSGAGSRFLAIIAIILAIISLVLAAIARFHR